MLTLVAAVLTYDLGQEAVVDIKEGREASDAWSLGLLSRNAISETREENDMMFLVS